MASSEINIGEAPAGTAIELHRGGALARREMVGGLLRPVARPEEVMAAQEETREVIMQSLKKGRDYGRVPGTKKDTMFVSGADRSAAAFGLAPEFEIMEKEIDHDRANAYVKREKVWRNQFKGDKEFTWREEPGQSEGLYRYVVRCHLVHRESGVVVGSGLGSCSTMESKYIDRPRDLENTVLKMAKKRAFVDAVLTTLGLHDQFTQDMEDNPELFGGREQEDGGGAEPQPDCPVCSGAMWDNRAKKKNPRAPDFKCKDRDCEGKLWPGEWPPKVEESGDDAFATAEEVAELRALAVSRGARPRWLEWFDGQARKGITHEQMQAIREDLPAPAPRAVQPDPDTPNEQMFGEAAEPEGVA